MHDIQIIIMAGGVAACGYLQPPNYQQIQYVMGIHLPHSIDSR